MGAIRVPASLTRSGVFEYLTADGRVIREWRSPEEVARADALRSIEDMPVTIGHPPGGVSPATYAARSVGHVRGDSVKVDTSAGPTDVCAKLVIARGDAIEGLTKSSDDPTRLVETSCGYEVELDHTPGVTPDGKAYDAKQKNMRYNHVALLRRGDGRLGTGVRTDAADGASSRLRLDAAGNQITAADGVALEGPQIMKLRIDGKEIEGDEKALQAAVDALEASRSAEKARADAHEKRQAEADAAAAKARRDSLESRARVVLGKATDGKDRAFDGLTDRQIKEACVKAKDSGVSFDGVGDAYVDGRFDALFGKEEDPEEKKKKAAKEAEKKGDHASPELRALLTPVRADGADDFTKEAEQIEKDSRDLWRRK
jgi:uncharacterized protein